VIAFAAIVLLAAVAIALVSPLLGRLAAILFFAWLAAAHAASAFAARLDPGPRGRMFLTAVFLLAVLGGALAIAAPIPPELALSEVGRSAPDDD